MTSHLNIRATFMALALRYEDKKNRTTVRFEMRIKDTYDVRYFVVP